MTFKHTGKHEICSQKDRLVTFRNTSSLSSSPCNPLLMANDSSYQGVTSWQTAGLLNKVTRLTCACVKIQRATWFCEIWVAILNGVIWLITGIANHCKPQKPRVNGTVPDGGIVPLGARLSEGTAMSKFGNFHLLLLNYATKNMIIIGIFSRRF